MDDNDRKELIDKVQKLLKLAQSANEHEASLASEKAYEILAKHNLTLADLKDQSGPQISGGFKTPSVTWRILLINTVAQWYFCSYFYVDKSKKKHGVDARFNYLVGEPHNIEVARLVIDYLSKTVVRLSKQAYREACADDRIQTSALKGYEMAFRGACAARICQRIYTKIEEAKSQGVKSSETGTTLPALADLYTKALALNQAALEQKLGKPPKVVDNKVKTKNPLGSYHGWEAGDKVSLDPQVDNKPKPQIE